MTERPIQYTKRMVMFEKKFADGEEISQIDAEWAERDEEARRKRGLELEQKYTRLWWELTNGGREYKHG